ncbi:MAG: DUF6118 family protein [Pseudomonadota bacterium]|nr:DUF6118 family protein [Pseudomonadota bacterium]
MDEERWPKALPYEPPAPDPATRAFTQLQGELALLRRAIEHLATEKAEIEVPDYSNTLAKIAKSLIAIESAPALQMTPEDFGARFEAAAAMARREDRAMLAEAKRELTENARSLRATIGTVATIDQQNRNLWRAAGGGFAAGCLLMTALPGFGTRLAPTDWHWPERLAARTVREPTLWEAGARLMRADSSQAWATLNHAVEMLRGNREAIEKCRDAATKAKESVRCTIDVAAD